MRYLIVLLIVIVSSAPAQPQMSLDALTETAHHVWEVDNDSIAPALDVAWPGDLIIILPGIYIDSTPLYLKDNVNIYLHRGAHLINNRIDAQDSGMVFWDGWQPVHCGIYGHGTLETTGGYLGESFCVSVRNPASVVEVQCDSIVAYVMALEADGGRLYVNCPTTITWVEHTIRLNRGGYVELWGDVYTYDSVGDGGGQSVYFKSPDDTAIIHGSIYSEIASYGAVFGDKGSGTFYLYGSIQAPHTRAIDMQNGHCYVYDGQITTNGAIRAEHGYFYGCDFHQVGSDYIFSNDTAYFVNCTGNADIGPSAIWYGDYNTGPQSVGVITETSTSCVGFLNGNIDELHELRYTVLPNDRIHKCAPSEFLYYTSFMAPAESFFINIIQNSDILPCFDIDRSGVDVFSNCEPIGVTVDDTGGQVYIFFDKASIGAEIVVQVPYITKSILREDAPIGPTIYYFETWVGNTYQAEDSLVVVSK